MDTPTNREEGQTGIEKNEVEEKEPSFDELAASSSGFISAKNYKKGQKVSFKVDSMQGMQKSEKYSSWQMIYNVTKDGEPKKYGMPGKIAQTLKDQYKIMDYKDLLGKVLTLLVVSANSGSNTFEVADCK